MSSLSDIFNSMVTEVNSVFSTNMVDNPAFREIYSNAEFKITFSENNLEAWGDFIPARGRGEPLAEEYVKSQLITYRIEFGIQEESIQDAIQKCNEGIVMKGVLLARGIPPVNGIREYMQKNPMLGKSQPFALKTPAPPPPGSNKVPDRNDKIDYRARSPFIIVRQGQALAKLKSPKPGIDGTSVNNLPIPHAIDSPESVEGGDNTRMEGRFLVASINGQLVETRGVMHVRESLNIKGPVDYKTGNIAFPGDVIIEGPVSDGFKIYSGGSINIKQTLDVTDAVSKGDLVVAGGIIGRGQALVKVGGNLRTKFIENCQVACRKTVSVTSEIINSRIYTLGNVEMGEKSLIIGGDIYAANGLCTGGIGKKSTRGSKIHCGIDFTVEQEKEKNNNILRLLAAKLERLRQLLEDPQVPDERKAKLEATQVKLEEEQQKVIIKVGELLSRLNANDNACVEVTGEIAAGTLIEICQIALFVTEPLKRVKITLDRENNKLATVKL